GLEQNGKLHPVQKAFIDDEAMQCAYCTCGMIMSDVALLRKTPKPSRDEIIRAMDGNICRCCAYPRIMNAIELAAKGGAQRNFSRACNPSATSSMGRCRI